MQGSMGKAVCDHVIRDSIKMYTHKGAQLRLHGQHYSFSFSFFFFLIVLGFIATFMVLYPFIYNFTGCLKKYIERERKESLKKIYCMEWQWYWNTGLALHGPQQRLWPREWKEQQQSLHEERAEGRLSWDPCSFPREFCSTGMQGTMYLGSASQVYLWWPSAAFHCKYFPSHVLAPTPSPCPAPLLLQMQPPKFLQSEFPILTFCLVLYSMACSDSP